MSTPTLSVVVPVYNEAAGLSKFHKLMLTAVNKAVSNSYEIIYVDDGSDDDSAKLISGLHANDPRVKLLKLSRNFGKESALAAGITAATGEAVLTIDGDGQHPPELIPEFVKAWKGGAQVVIGLRTGYSQNTQSKRTGSTLFHKAFNKVAGQELLQGSTDYRLMNREVQQAFLRLEESGRITRGLIDWLGFKREFIPFEAAPRGDGSASYSTGKRFQLALDSFVSLTPRPLYIFGGLGIVITCGALLLGLAVIIEQLILGDPWRWQFTGTAMLGILILFLVGIVLMSQGILALYISHIHDQTKRRPLYVIDSSGSRGHERGN